MLGAIASLLACQTAGEILVRALAVPFPGPVVGMGLLFAWLAWNGRGRTGPQVPVELGGVADTLLRHLSLLFIPAAVGIVQYLTLIGRYPGSIAASVVVSTVATLVLTALVFLGVSRITGRPAPARAGDEAGR